MDTRAGALVRLLLSALIEPLASIVYAKTMSFFKRIKSSAAIRAKPLIQMQ
jgi:hypothetical protein